MTLEAQRILIAEACGWTLNPLWPVTPTHAVYRRGDELRITQELPRYTADLNAMHEAERMLTTEQWQFYTTELFQDNHGENKGTSKALAHATSMQKAEAFLKAIGRWT